MSGRRASHSRATLRCGLLLLLGLLGARTAAAQDPSTATEASPAGSEAGRPPGGEALSGAGDGARVGAPGRGIAGPGREADAIIARLQAVAADYGDAVRDGVVINDAGHRRQMRRLDDVLALAAAARAPDDLRERLAGLRARAQIGAPASEIYETCRSVIADVVAALWASMMPPASGRLKAPYAPNPIARAAPIFAARCASCHGADGAGHGPDAASLRAQPRSLLDGGLVDLMSPYRAFDAITVGMEDGAMPAFADLGEDDRWALSFYVMSLRQPLLADAEAGKRALARAHLGLPSLEELSLRTDRDLAIWLAARVSAIDVAPALCYLRTDGVAAAAASPFEGMRRTLRAVVRAYASDPALASAMAEDLIRRYAALAPEVRRRDRMMAVGAEGVLRKLAGAIAARAPGAEVQASALRAFSALGGAQAALARPPRTGLSAIADTIPRSLQLALPTVLVLAVLLAARLSLSRGGSPGAGDDARQRPEARGLARRLLARVPMWALLLAAGISIAAAFVARQAIQGGEETAPAASP